jgi:hypothetical protein
MLEVLFEQFMLVKVFVVDNVKAIENSGEEGSQAFLLLFLSVWMFLPALNPTLALVSVCGDISPSLHVMNLEFLQ